MYNFFNKDLKRLQSQKINPIKIKSGGLTFDQPKSRNFGNTISNIGGWGMAGAQALNGINTALGGDSNDLGNGLMSFGSMVGSIPTPYTAAAGAIISGIGAVANGLTDNVNDDYKNAVGSRIADLSNIQSNASDYTGLMEDNSALQSYNFDVGDVKNWGGKGMFISEANSARNQARQDALEAKRNALMTASANINSQAQNINQNNMYNLYSRLRACGGKLGKRHDFGGDLMTNGAVWDTGMTFVGNGGSHEQNPYEGVQMGVDSQGIPNLVEEGEVIWNDYVFSKRLKVPKSFRESQKIKKDDISFAEAAEIFNDKERPNDPISKRTRDARLSLLMDTQEDVRMKKQAREAKAQFNALSPEEQLGIMQAAQQQAAMGSPEDEMIYNGGYPQQGIPMEGEEALMAACGGRLAHKFDGTTEPTQKLYRDVRTYNPAWFAQQAGTLNIPTDNEAWKGFLNTFNPRNSEANLTAFNNIYADAQRQRALETYVAGRKKAEEQRLLDSGLYRKNANGNIYKANTLNEDRTGWYIGTDNSWLSPSDFNTKQAAYLEAKKIDPKKLTTDQKNLIDNWEKLDYKDLSRDYNMATGDFARRYNGSIDYSTTPVSDILAGFKAEEGFKWDPNSASKLAYEPKKSNSWQSYLRYTPALGGAIGLITDLATRPDYSRAQNIIDAGSYQAPQISTSPIGNYKNKQQFDRNFYLTQARGKAASTDRALLNAGNGNIGATYTGLLGNAYNTIENEGRLSRQAEDFLMNEELQRLGFNRGTDMFNAQQNIDVQKANMAAQQQALRDRYTGIVAGNTLMDNIDARRQASMSANMTNIFNSLGQIGEESYDNDRLEALIRRGVLKDLYSNKSACGGMLTKKRKGGRK